MRALTFVAPRFEWRPHEKTLEDAELTEGETRTVSDAVIVFMDIEAKDILHGNENEADHSKALRKILKHVKWQANKKGCRTIVLHSFAHLGGDRAAPGDALNLMKALGQRLRQVGYRVERTPFGWNCSWDMSVIGEGIGKVWKEI